MKIFYIVGLALILFFIGFISIYDRESRIKEIKQKQKQQAKLKSLKVAWKEKSCEKYRYIIFIEWREKIKIKLNKKDQNIVSHFRDFLENKGLTNNHRFINCSTIANLSNYKV